MEARIEISDNVVVDNIDLISKELSKGEDWQILVYEGTDDDKAVGIFLEQANRDKSCTIMFELTTSEALYLGKSLIALTEVSEMYNNSLEGN